MRYQRQQHSKYHRTLSETLIRPKTIKYVGKRVHEERELEHLTLHYGHTLYEADRGNNNVNSEP